MFVLNPSNHVQRVTRHPVYEYNTYNMLHSLGIWDVCLLCIGYCTAPSDGKQPEYFLRAEKSLSGLPSSTLYVKVLQTYLLQSQRLLIVRGGPTSYTGGLGRYGGPLKKQWCLWGSHKLFLLGSSRNTSVRWC